MNEIYNLREAARGIEVPGLGRNKLYRILKEMDIVDQRNRPEQQYVVAGLLTLPLSKYDTVCRRAKSHVTLVLGHRGLIFIKEAVLRYLADNPMPTFPRRSKVQNGINI